MSGFRNKFLKSAFPLIAVALLLSSCVDGGSGHDPAGNTGGLVASVDWGSGTSALGSPPSALVSTPGGQYSHSPPSVITVHALVSGADMDTIVVDFQASDGGGQIDGIAAGTDRTLTLQGLDSSDVPIYAGSVGGLTITADTVTDAGTIFLSALGSATPEFTVTPTAGLLASEGGGTAEFTVVLDTDPAADVTIGVSTSDTT